MRIAIISDIHGNLEALEAVLRDVDRQSCDRTYCLGDVVGYGPEPNAACVRLRALGIGTIQGNHDEAAALDIPLQEARLSPLAYKSLLWTRGELSPENREWLRQLPHRLELPELNAALYHADPQNPEAWGYITSRYQAWDILEKQTATLYFIGHTHQPFVWAASGGFVFERRPEVINIERGSRYLINVGSVGQPRNRDPRSSYVIADREEQTVTFRKVDYPILMTQRRIREQNLPDRLAERLALGV
jgi:predicted phosphodiesterase